MELSKRQRRSYGRDGERTQRTKRRAGKEVVASASDDEGTLTVKGIPECDALPDGSPQKWQETWQQGLGLGAASS